MLFVLAIGGLIWCYGCVSIILGREDAPIPDCLDRIRIPIVIFVAFFWPGLLFLMAICTMAILLGMLCGYLVEVLILFLDRLFSPRQKKK